MMRVRDSFTAKDLVCLAGLCLVSVPVFGRDVKMAIYPQKASAEAGKFSLLPPEKSLVDGDAVPLYAKAVQALPDKAGDTQIREWVDMPLDRLPLDQVGQTLTRYTESLRSAAKAARCRRCDWPEVRLGADMPQLAEYRRLAFVVALWAKMEIANGGYEGAIVALQTGFGMARHLGQAPTIVEGLVGTAVGAIMCQEVEEFVQRQGAPNLHAALASMPKPFVQMEKAIEAEKKAGASQVGMEEQMAAAHERCRAIVKRLDTNLAALQCVEAIRSYAVSHGGKLPATLAEITEVAVPMDPMGERPFQYSPAGSTAALESFLPSGSGEKDRIRYEITVKN